MKVWLVFHEEQAYECACLVIYDHKPSKDELLSVFCPTVIDGEWFYSLEVELDKIFNKNLTNFVYMEDNA